MRATPTTIWEALDYVDNLRLHGKSLWDAATHAWHRYGIEPGVLVDYVVGEQRLDPGKITVA